VPRRPDPPPETLEERWLNQEQTTRNLIGLEAEQEGRLDDAIALYERNAAEGFSGDWPYGRLVAIYEKQEAFDEAERVLRRAIEVFESSSRRTPQDRRTMIRTFRKRLSMLEQLRKRAAKAASKPAP